jgi:hypothetical protein
MRMPATYQHRCHPLSVTLEFEWRRLRAWMRLCAADACMRSEACTLRTPSSSRSYVLTPTLMSNRAPSPLHAKRAYPKPWLAMAADVRIGCLNSTLKLGNQRRSARSGFCDVVYVGSESQRPRREPGLRSQLACDVFCQSAAKKAYRAARWDGITDGPRGSLRPICDRIQARAMSSMAPDRSA